VALQIYRGMFNLPQTWGAALGPLADALKWLGMRFDGPPVETEHSNWCWLIAWMAFMWSCEYPAAAGALASRL